MIKSELGVNELSTVKYCYILDLKVQLSACC